MERRAFLNMSGGAMAAMMMPFGRAIAADELIKPVEVKFKKMLADTALTAATQAGASYCDVRIGRYLNQFITTRDLNIENVTNTESAGVGVRVIANGAYGFAATSDMSPDGVAGAARQAVAIAKANSRLQAAGVQLAPTPGVGEVAWATPIKKDWRTVPIKEKADTSKFLLGPMPGMVVSLAVDVGQEVRAGDTLCIVEAMKMENVLKAERDGKVSKVLAKPGDSLNVDAVILEFA